MSGQEQEFRLGAEFFTHFRRVTLTRTLPLMLLAGVAGVVMAHQGSRSLTGFDVVVGVVLELFLLYTVRRTYRQQTERLRGFRLGLGADGLRRTQPGLADVVIAADQIRRVTEHPDRGLRIHGPTPAQVIAIPATIERFQQVRQMVQAWRPIETTTAWYGTVLSPTLASVGTIAAMVTVFMSANAVLVTVLGTVLIAVLLWAFFLLRRNPHLEDKTRRSAWLVFAVIYAVAAKVWSLWMG